MHARPSGECCVARDLTATLGRNFLPPRPTAALSLSFGKSYEHCLPGKGASAPAPDVGVTRLELTCCFAQLLVLRITVVIDQIDYGVPHSVRNDSDS